MNSTTAQKIRLDFGNLPLVEVATRVSLKEPVELRFAIVNSVYEKLRDRFPVMTEPKNLETPPGIRMTELSMGPGHIMGAVYTNNPDGLSITMHGQVVIARWVKRVPNGGPGYPRFPALREALRQAVGAFKEASGDKFPPIVVTNMTYVNLLRVSHSAPVVGDYFSESAQIQATKDAAEVYKVEAGWRAADSVDLRYALEQVTAKVDDEEVEAYRLTTAAGTRIPEGGDAITTLDGIHDRLQVFFRELISKKAQDEWQLNEVPLD